MKPGLSLLLKGSAVWIPLVLLPALAIASSAVNASGSSAASSHSAAGPSYSPVTLGDDDDQGMHMPACRRPGDDDDDDFGIQSSFAWGDDDDDGVNIRFNFARGDDDDDDFHVIPGFLYWNACEAGHQRACLWRENPLSGILVGIYPSQSCTR